MPPAELPARKRWLALVVLCVTVLVANLDSTVLNVTLPTLVRDLSATSGDLQWIVDSYIVVFAGSLLAAGSLADRIGRKRTLLAGLAVFAGGSAWAAFSGDVGTLIAARASMGIGGALMIPSTLSIISNMFGDPAERRRAIGRWGATSGVGVALGPIIGGFLLARFWWGSVFLLNVPIAMAGLALPTATGSVLGSVPPTDSGVASAADTTAIQLGGALGVAVVGSLLATRYQDRMTGALSGRPLPATVKSSLGGALAAARAGGATGPLIHLAKTAFISGMDLGLLTGAVVAVAGCLVALICLPARSGRNDQLIGTRTGVTLSFTTRPGPVSAPSRTPGGSPRRRGSGSRRRPGPRTGSSRRRSGWPPARPGLATRSG